jgi:hypothetical protein
MSFLGMLDRRVTIERATESLSATGVATRTWTVIASAVPFKIGPASGRQVLTDAGRLVDADAQGYCQISVDVTDEGPGDRITDGAITYDVVLVERAPFDHHFELLLARTPL